MTNLITVLLVSLTSVSAFAYKDGVYRCKNSPNIPDNVYQIKTISLDATGIRLPYVEINRYFDLESINRNAVISEAKIRGLASVSVGSDGIERLMIGAFRLEIENDRIRGCNQVSAEQPASTEHR